MPCEVLTLCAVGVHSRGRVIQLIWPIRLQLQKMPSYSNVYVRNGGYSIIYITLHNLSGPQTYNEGIALFFASSFS